MLKTRSATPIANDAAGEGVNLQRGAHLMVNYDTTALQLNTAQAWHLHVRDQA